MAAVRRAWRRIRDQERGNALMEFAVLGITVLIPLMWIILCVFDIQRAMYGVSAAAREATRAFTLSSSVAEGQAQAKQAAFLALDDQRLEGVSEETIPDVACGDGNGNFSDSYCLQPNSVAYIRITYDVELPFWPAMFGYKPSIDVVSEHTTPYGQYRTGGG